MAKELIDGREYFEGEPVEIFVGRFRGQFNIPEIDGAPMSKNELVTFMVTARCSIPKFDNVPKTQEQRRSNTFNIESVTVLDKEQAMFLYDSLGKEVYGVNEGIIEHSTTTGKIEKAKQEQEELEL